jgi:hypothetical protein
MRTVLLLVVFAAVGQRETETVVSGRVEKYDAEEKVLHVRRLADGELFKLSFGEKSKAFIDSLPVEPDKLEKGHRILAWHLTPSKTVTRAMVYVNDKVPPLPRDAAPKYPRVIR